MPNEVQAVVYSATADADISRIFAWLADVTSPLAAFTIVEDIQDFVDGLELASERGTARDDLAPGLRVVGFRRATVMFHVSDEEVLILRIFYGGEDWESVFTRR